MVARGWLRAVITLLIAVGPAACGASPTNPSAAGRLSIRMTDAPIQEVTEVNVYIEGLKVKRVDEPEQRIAVDIGLVDLLTLQNTSMLLATVGAEPAEYEFIMVELDQERSHLLLGSTQVGLKIPSETIKVLGGFEVTEEMTTIVTLDFDAQQSLKQLGNGDWLMTPVIVIAAVEVVES